MAEEAIFEEVEGVYVGIDFGTSNSVVTYFKDNKFQQVKFKNKKLDKLEVYNYIKTKQS